MCVCVQAEKDVLISDLKETVHILNEKIHNLEKLIRVKVRTIPARHHPKRPPVHVCLSACLPACVCVCVCQDAKIQALGQARHMTGVTAQPQQPSAAYPPYRSNLR